MLFFFPVSGEQRFVSTTANEVLTNTFALATRCPAFAVPLLSLFSFPPGMTAAGYSSKSPDNGFLENSMMSFERLMRCLITDLSDRPPGM